MRVKGGEAGAEEARVTVRRENIPSVRLAEKLRKALQEPDAPQEAPPEQRPSVRKELEALRAAAAAQAHACPTPGYTPPERIERT